MATRLRFPDEGDKYLAMVDLCERFAFRVYVLLDKRSDAGQKAIYRVANQLYTNKVSFDEATEQLQWELLEYCSLLVFVNEFRLLEEGNNWYGW